MSNMNEALIRRMRISPLAPFKEFVEDKRLQASHEVLNSRDCCDRARRMLSNIKVMREDSTPEAPFLAETALYVLRIARAWRYVAGERYRVERLYRLGSYPHDLSEADWR